MLISTTHCVRCGTTCMGLSPSNTTPKVSPCCVGVAGLKPKSQWFGMFWLRRYANRHFSTQWHSKGANIPTAVSSHFHSRSALDRELNAAPVKMLISKQLTACPMWAYMHESLTFTKDAQSFLCPLSRGYSRGASECKPAAPGANLKSRSGWTLPTRLDWEESRSGT